MGVSIIFISSIQIKLGIHEFRIDVAYILNDKLYYY